MIIDSPKPQETPQPKCQHACQECGRTFYGPTKCPSCRCVDDVPPQLIQFGEAVRNDPEILDLSAQ